MTKETEPPLTPEQTHLKEDIIRQIRSSENPLIFQRVKAVLDEQATVQQIYHLPAIRKLIKEEQQKDYELRIRQDPEEQLALSRYEAQTEPLMFYLGIISLLVIGLLITVFTEDELSPLIEQLLPWAGGLAGLIYLLSAAYIAGLFYTRRRHRPQISRSEKRIRLLSLLFPPLHLGSRNAATGEYIWIPFWHWSRVNQGLFLELKRRFVIPMIAIALLIIPVLIIEWKFMEQIREEAPNLRIRLILNSVQTFIWCAFTFEFILLICISNRKLHYIKKNWIDLLIILLPFVSFLRTLRISQIARLKYATRSFKLRGVVTKARQGLIFVDFLQRIFRLRPENEIRRLYRLLQENRRDAEELQEKIKEVAHLIEQKKKRRSAEN